MFENLLVGAVYGNGLTEAQAAGTTLSLATLTKALLHMPQGARAADAAAFIDVATSMATFEDEDGVGVGAAPDEAPAAGRRAGSPRDRAPGTPGRP